MLDVTQTYGYIVGRSDLSIIYSSGAGTGAFFLKFQTLTAAGLYARIDRTSAQATGIVLQQSGVSLEGTGYITGYRLSTEGYLLSFNLSTGNVLLAGRIERQGESIRFSAATNTLIIVANSLAPNYPAGSILYVNAQTFKVQETRINSSRFLSDLVILNPLANTVLAVGLDYAIQPVMVNLAKQLFTCNANQTSLFTTAGAPLSCACLIGYSGLNCSTSVCR